MLKVYTKENCRYCVQAKNLLNYKHVEYQEISIGRDLSVQDFQLSFPHVRTVPFILNESDVIGGYQDLLNYIDGEMNRGSKEESFKEAC